MGEFGYRCSNQQIRKKNKRTIINECLDGMLVTWGGLKICTTNRNMFIRFGETKKSTMQYKYCFFGFQIKLS